MHNGTLPTVDVKVLNVGEVVVVSACNNDISANLKVVYMYK